MLTQEDLRQIRHVFKEEVAPIDLRLSALEHGGMRRIVQEELAPLIQTVERLDRRQEAFDRKQDAFDQRQDTFELRQATFEHRQATFEHRQATFEHRQATLDRRQDQFDQRMNRFELRMEHFEIELHRQGVLAEEDRKVLATVLESVVATNERLDRMASVEPRVSRCEEDIAVLRQVVTAHVKDEKLHQRS